MNIASKLSTETFAKPHEAASALHRAGGHSVGAILRSADGYHFAHPSGDVPDSGMFSALVPTGLELVQVFRPFVGGHRTADTPAAFLADRVMVETQREVLYDVTDAVRQLDAHEAMRPPGSTKLAAA